MWTPSGPRTVRLVCVAHGYLTLSLANLFLPQLVSYDRLKMGVNYGCDKVRFPAPVKVDSRLRGRGEVVRRRAGQGRWRAGHRAHQGRD